MGVPPVRAKPRTGGGSRPVVGSSRKSTSGSVIREAARSSRRRMPPLYCLTALCPVPESSKRSSSSSARARARRAPRWCSRPNSSRFCRPPSSSSSAACWPSRPMRGRTTYASRTTSCPATSIRPASGRSRVARILTRVVLPAPFGPSTPCTVPRATVRSSPSSAGPLPPPLYVLCASSTVIAASDTETPSLVKLDYQPGPYTRPFFWSNLINGRPRDAAPPSRTGSPHPRPGRRRTARPRPRRCRRRP
ncbi:hypothetical protein RKD28_003391 [Streptomyces sp. SAI-229]